MRSHVASAAVAALLLGTGAAPRAARACSVFCVERPGELLVARNYDWPFDEGMVVVNPRGLKKRALVYWGEETRRLAKWTARHGSVTFVQYGREIAFGGLNEAGLSVHEQWLDQTEYPRRDRRPSVSVDQLVQYLLDGCETVEQAIAAVEAVRVRPTPDDFAKVHFFVTDAAGGAAVLEFLDGKLVVHAGGALPVKAMTNDSYEDSMRYLAARPPPVHLSSLDRFARAAAFAAGDLPAVPDDRVAAAFQALDTLAQWHTRFQVVFDLEGRVVHFRSSRNREPRRLALADLEFACGAPAQTLDLSAEGGGDVRARLVPYTTAANERLIEGGWNALGHLDVYRPALELVSEYPETLRCEGKRR